MPGMGWIRDLPDPRDFRFSARVRGLELPPEVDHRPKMPPVLDQSQLGSCTANTLANAYDYQLNVQGRPPLRASRLFQYYNARILEGTIDSDSGASIRNTIKAVADYGACPEDMWPYDIPRFKEQPPDKCYVIGQAKQVLEYMRVDQDREQIMAALFNGYVVLFGMLVYKQFENVDRTGIITMPRPGDRPLGGHSQLACGYQVWGTGEAYIISQNSWGTGHGDKGYVYIPMSYLTDPQLAADFWVIKLIEPDPEPVPIPTPPEPVDDYYVGPGIRKHMMELGDRPASNEWYPVAGLSVAASKSGRIYYYIADTDTVVAMLPDSKLVGTH